MWSLSSKTVSRCFQVAIFITITSSLVESQPRVPVYSVYQSYPSTSAFNDVQYDYRYSIDDSVSGVISNRWEERLGEYVKGSYSLLEPNGKIRTVDYEVDGKKGFQAVVHTKFPANVLLSSQQLEQSRYLTPEPEINLRLANPPPLEPYQQDPLVVPPNYHAIRAAAYPYLDRLQGRYNTNNNSNRAQYQPQYQQKQQQYQQPQQQYQQQNQYQQPQYQQQQQQYQQYRERPPQPRNYYSL
ncbi:hypothetical protein LSTR_LSTR009220 [Laodelphax striatellus]|uniref:Uncharacterized protein n=1 Tax=Laodelphax striatellus TaxID=195883 RepID=A0A482WQK4_LAOST|nr:hypothetical protein LSTR_LSTR009220 [Laodelphax striatellus]